MKRRVADRRAKIYSDTNDSEDQNNDTRPEAPNPTFPTS